MFLIGRMALLKFGVVITKRNILLNTLLFFIFQTVYFVFVFLVSNVAKNSFPDYSVIIQASFNFVIAITMITSGFLVKKIDKRVLIYTSFIATILTVTLFFSPSDILRIIALLIIGAFFGIWSLEFLTYFWKKTVAEERGRVAGLIGLAVLPLIFVIQLVAPSLDFLGEIIAGAIFTLAIMIVSSLKTKSEVEAAKSGEGTYFEKRTILLYAIPWILFSLINVTLAANATNWITQQVSSSFHLLLLGLQFVGVIVGSIVGGTVADLVGRRTSLIISLTAYGTSAALIALFNSNELILAAYILNGLSWGVLFTLYIFVIWGDLANKDNCAKMYSIGIASYYLAGGIGPLIQISMPLATSSLVTCLLVFLLNIPIALAPELLSPDFRERLSIKLHMSAIKKISKRSKNQGK